MIETNGGHPPLTYKRFQMLVASMPPPEPPVEPLSLALMGRCVTPVTKDHRDKYGVPLLEELGMAKDTSTRAASTALLHLSTGHGGGSRSLTERVYVCVPVQGSTLKTCFQQCGQEERLKLWSG